MADNDTTAAANTHTKRGDGINITRAEVMGGIARYSEKDQADLLWLHGYTTDELGGSRSRLCEMVGVTWSPLSKIWCGRYEASIEQSMQKVRIFRRKVETTVRKRFISTLVTQRIMALCDVAMQRAVMVMISGATGRSKTHTLLEWKHQNNHGRAVYVYCRKSGGIKGLLDSVAEALNISPSRTAPALKKAIEQSLDQRNVLILDEFAHLYPVGRRGSIDAIEWVREIQEICGCGIVLCATDGLEALLRSGPYAQWFDQFVGRIELSLPIPRKFSRQEVADLLGGYVDDPDPALVTAARLVANQSRRGCRDLFRHLDRAAAVAAECGKPLSADLLTETIKAANNLLTIPEE